MLSAVQNALLRDREHRDLLCALLVIIVFLGLVPSALRRATRGSQASERPRDARCFGSERTRTGIDRRCCSTNFSHVRDGDRRTGAFRIKANDFPMPALDRGTIIVIGRALEVELGYLHRAPTSVSATMEFPRPRNPSASF